MVAKCDPKVPCPRHRLQVIDESGWISEYLVSADFSPDGELLAIGSDQGVEVWRTGDGTKALELPRQAATGRVQFGADGTRLFVANAHRLMTWRLTSDSAKEESRWQRPCAPDEVFAMAATRDGSLVAVGCDSGLVRLGDPARSTPSVDAKGHTELVRALAFTDDGAKLVSASDDGTVRVWDRGGQPIRTISTSLGRVLALAPLGNGQAVASGTTAEIKLYDLGSGEVVRSFAHSTDATDRPRSLSASRDGTWFVSAGRNLLDVWDAASGRQLLQQRKLGAEQAVLARDGTRCAWLTTKHVQLYDLPKRERR